MTKMGKRLLRSTLYQPLSNINEIKERQKVVEIIINNQIFYTQLSLVFFFFYLKTELK